MINGTWSDMSDTLVDNSHNKHVRHPLMDRESRDSGNTSNSASSSPYWLRGLSLSSSPCERKEVRRGSNSSTASSSTSNVHSKDSTDTEVKSALTMALTEKSPFQSTLSYTNSSQPNCNYNCQSDDMMGILEEDFSQFVTLDETPKDVIFFSPSLNNTSINANNYNHSSHSNSSQHGSSANDLLRFKESIGKEGQYRESSTPLNTAILAATNWNDEEQNRLYPQNSKTLKVNVDVLKDNTTYTNTLANASTNPSGTGVTTNQEGKTNIDTLHNHKKNDENENDEEKVVVGKMTSNQRLIHIQGPEGKAIKVINNDYYGNRPYQKANTCKIGNVISKSDEMKDNDSHVHVSSAMPASGPSMDSLHSSDSFNGIIWKDCNCEYDEVESVILREGYKTSPITKETETWSIKEATPTRLSRNNSQCKDHTNDSVYTPTRSTTSSPRFSTCGSVDSIKMRSMSIMSEASQGEDLHFILER